MDTNYVTYYEDRLTKKLELDRAAIIFVVLAVSALVCTILIETNGNVAAAAALLIVISVLLIIFYRIDWGFNILFFMVLLFDQDKIPGFDPITLRADFFKNIKENSLIPSISAGVINPVELILFTILLAWFVAISFRKQTRVQHIQEWGLGLVFVLSLMLSFVNGMQSGGDFLPALWEIRALFYFSLLFFVVPQIIQTKKQIETLMWILIAGVAFKALQGSWRFVSLGLSCAGYETLTNHEDPVFMTILFVFLVSLLTLKENIKQRNVLLYLLPVLMLGFFAGQRRAAYAGMFVSFIAFIILLQSHERAKVFKVLMILLVVLSVYAAAFWNSESKIASPLRLIKSSIDPDKGNQKYLSNLYREFERYNLAYTIKSEKPVTGIGFGNKYKILVPLADLHFPLRDYIPHNEILWVFVKSGAIGFFIFWFFFNALIFRCSSIYKKLNDPYLKSICIIIVIAILNQMVVSYYDLQLTYYRNMIVLGTLCGLIPALANLSKERAIETEYEEN